MSLVLMNAFRVEAVTLDDAFAALHPWRSKIQEIALRAEAGLHASAATTLIDRAATISLRKGETTPPPVNPLGEVFKDIEDRRKTLATSGYRDPDVDFDFSVTLIPGADGIFGLVYCEQDTWVKAFLENGPVIHEPYWDNTDQDEDVSDAEWEKRGQMWRDVLARDPYRRFGHCGLNLPMTPYLGSVKVPEIVSAQPDFPSRARAMAKDAMRHDFLAKANGPQDMHRIFAQLGRFDRYLRSNPGQEALQVFEAACKDLMSPKLVQSDFLGGDFSVPVKLPPNSV